MRPAYWDRACADLAERDPIMAGLVATFPNESLAQKGDPFATLCRAIVSQQISVKAAEAIWARLNGALYKITPASLQAADVALLRELGLSRPKILYLLELAGHAASGQFNPPHWQYAADEVVMAELLAIKGIGQWTAEMFMIFSLQRPDILPVKDIGLQKAIARHYFQGERPTTADILAMGERLWQPWRSVATWYLWRSLDPVVVAY